MSTTINKKINQIYTLLAYLADGREIYTQDESLQIELFGKTGEAQDRALRRYLDDICDLYADIVLIEKKKKEFSDRKVTVYRVLDREKDVSNVLKYFIENSNDFSWVLQMIHENDPSFIKDFGESARYAVEKNIKEDEGIFLFKSTPFENLDNEKHKKIFSILKLAVKNHEYRTIVYQKNKLQKFEDVKCLKMIYMNNNWYLAIENEKKHFRVLRLSFIEEVLYASADKENYQPSRIEFYNEYFASLQNAMTLFGKPFKKATLKVSPHVALYFAEDMKPFFPSQEYVRTEEDGSIIFTVAYTQALEILPFVKQWQPDIEIVSPVELRNAMAEDMKKSMEMHIN